MISRYGMLCEVMDMGSFSAVAERFGYAQSTISQAVKSVEEELGSALLERKRRSISWTADGLRYEPFIRAVYSAERALEQKHKEMTGMEEAVIRIGTFTSVSRNILPGLMAEFKSIHPAVRFELVQGNYNDIRNWLETGFVDIGFLAEELTSGLTCDILYKDAMLAVLSEEHPMSTWERIPLEALTEDPFIQLDEGEFSTILRAMEARGLKAQVEYVVYDDYSIIAMVKSGLGISVLFETVVTGYEHDVALRPLTVPITRTICLCCRDIHTLSYSASRFRGFALEKLR